MVSESASFEPAPRLAVGAVVLRATGQGPEVVLVRRARPPMLGTLSLPGGKVAWGERLSDAVRREVFEETSLEVEVGPLLEVIELVTEAFHYVIHDYVAFARGGTLRAGDDAAEAITVPVNRLAELALTDEVRRMIALALPYLR